MDSICKTMKYIEGKKWTVSQWIVQLTTKSNSAKCFPQAAQQLPVKDKARY